MEGVMLKRVDSPYLPGKRTDAWRKVKCAAWQHHAEGGSAGSHPS
jgi:ATP-dependent DNA ligase